MTRLTTIVAALILASATTAGAQTWELSALGGYTPSVDLERQAPEVDGVALGGGPSWTFQAARFFTPHWSAQVQWSEHFSSLDVAVAGESTELFSLVTSQLHADVVYQPGTRDARTQPFVFAGVGATFFTATDVPSESKTSLGFGGGVKIFPWPSVGLVGQVRYTHTLLNDEAAGFLRPVRFLPVVPPPARLRWRRGVPVLTVRWSTERCLTPTIAKGELPA